MPSFGKENEDMSRIGNRILDIPQGVSVNVDENNNVNIKGPKGELNNHFDARMTIKVEGNTVVVNRPNDNQNIISLHGTTNALIRNMILGVSEGYQKELEAVGVGYRFNISGNKIVINAGYSNPKELIIPSGIKATSASNTELTLEGIDKQAVNEFAANVRKIRPPEPYKGKGIRYKGERVRRKAGKKAA